MWSIIIQSDKIKISLELIKYKWFFQAMWLMLQQEKPDDFVISMFEQHSVRTFVEKAFKHINMEIE